MNEKIFNDSDLYKGYDFWLGQLKTTDVYDQLSFFNDIITEKRPPHPDAGYHLVLKDVDLDVKSVIFIIRIKMKMAIKLKTIAGIEYLSILKNRASL